MKGFLLELIGHCHTINEATGTGFSWLFDVQDSRCLMILGSLMLTEILRIIQAWAHAACASSTRSTKNRLGRIVYASSCKQSGKCGWRWRPHAAGTMWLPTTNAEFGISLAIVNFIIMPMLAPEAIRQAVWQTFSVSSHLPFKAIPFQRQGVEHV